MTTIEMGRGRYAAMPMVSFSAIPPPARTILWAAGGRCFAGRRMAGGGGRPGGAGCSIDPDLSVHRSPEIFVIGDAARPAAGWSAGPRRCAGRQQQGRHVAATIRTDLQATHPASFSLQT